jgi:phosphatidate cytidylyltransferase
MKRIATAAVLLPVIVWVALLSPNWAFNTVLAAIGLAAFHEFDGIVAAHGVRRAGVPGMAAGLVLLFAPQPDLVAVLIVILAMILGLFARDLRDAMPGAAALLLGVFYIFGAWRCARSLRDLNPHWLMVALLVSWAGDTAAYYVGRACGRHKLAPLVSPGKTWEGAFGSVAGGVLAAGVYTRFLIPLFPLLFVIAIAAAANIAGQIGDLCESALKRGGGVKDSGTTLPGHGGWLDRVDSSLFSIPVVYAALKFIAP